MKNPNWYYHCDLKLKTALEYRQLPEFYGNMGSVHDFTDETLADLSFAVPDRGFLREEAAQVLGISQDSMYAARESARVLVVQDIRAQRDEMLVVTDTAAMADRWSSMDTVSKNKVDTYRQALRDITQQDCFNVAWPHLPVELDFVRSYVWPDSIPLSEGLRVTLEQPSPDATRDELIADHWQRIQDIRDARIAGGTQVEGYWFYTDSDSISRYLALMIAGPDLMPQNILWKTMDGTKVPMTYDLVKQVYVAIMSHTNQVYNHGEDMKATLEAWPDPTTFDVNAAWPIVYADTLVA